MKTIIKLALLILVTLGFASCVNTTSVSERALVKGIFIDELQNGNVHVSVIVYTNEPGAGTADIITTAAIYSAEDETIDKAIKNAQEQQNKTAFYEQNNVVLLGENAINNLSQYLAYFKTEEISGANLSVFLTPFNSDTILQTEKNMQEIIKACESLSSKSVQSTNKTQKILELNFDEENLFNGYLPILKIENEKVIGIEQLMVFKSGKPTHTLNGIAVDILLLLSGKLKNLDIEIEHEDTTYNINTQNIFAQYITAENGNLKIVFSAKAHTVNENANQIYNSQKNTVLNYTNKILSETCEEILQLTTMQNNDFINLNWHTLQKEHKYINDINVEFNIYE